MSFPPEFYTYLKQHSLTGIKGGKERPSFLEIWMVEINGRVFARSWNKSKRSWFTTFIELGEGQIKFGDSIINVKGKQLLNDPELTELINQAYLKRYNKPRNIPYAQGISQPEYADYTMEFMFDGRE